MPSSLPFTANETDSEFTFTVNVPSDAKTLSLLITGASIAPTGPAPITSVFGIRVPSAKSHVPGVLIAGYQIGNQYHRRKIDQGDGSLSVGRLNGWTPQDHVHLSFVIDLASGEYNFTDNNESIGGKLPNAPKARGGQIVVSLGQTGIADNAYFPPYGWRFDSVAAAVDGRRVFASPAVTIAPIEPNKPATPPAALPDPSNSPLPDTPLLERLTETVSAIIARLASDHAACEKIANEVLIELRKH